MKSWAALFGVPAAAPGTLPAAITREEARISATGHTTFVTLGQNPQST